MRNQNVGRAIGLIVLGTVGGWITYSNVAVDHDMPLPKALDAERQTFESEHGGTLSYYVDADAPGRPLVFIHSINAAPSAMEMKPLFDHYRGSRPVYALELPGFGMSERADRRYSPELFAGAINDFLAQEVGEPADVVALSLSSEFAARGAMTQPGLARSLVLVSPTGLGATEINLPGGAIHSGLSFPLWSQPLFDLLTVRPSIRFFLGQFFTGDAPDELAEYAYLTAHQPGARYAPLYFLSGQLFTPDVRTAFYEQLTVPTLIIYDKDANVTFDMLPTLLQRNERVRAERIAPTMGLPFWEKLEATVGALEAFWGDV